MKNITTIALFIFWAAVVALLTSGLVFYTGDTQPATPSVNPGITLTMEELAKHNNASSCWLLINGKIYDVTSYLDQHPGDASTIIPTCGTDATKAYDTKGRTNPSPHSQNATDQLKAYYIGDLGQVTAPTVPSTTVISSPTQPTTPGTPTTPTTNPSVTLSTQEIAKHNTLTNCWMIVNGNVYDVTSYIPKHPGGSGTIKPYCGKDGSAAFEGLPHSTNAHTLLAKYLVGPLGQQATPKPTTPTTPTTPTQPTTPTTPTQPTTNPSVTLSAQEIAKHSTLTDCWMIVNGNVYNVTSYIPRHPGGSGTIRPYCGKDGSAAFEGLPHSTKAHTLLASYLVGAVGQTTVQPTTPTTNPTTPTTPSTGGGRGDDDDDDD